MEKPQKTGLELLREPFPQNQISLLPKPYKKDSEKGNCKECGGWHGLPAAHIEYVGHAALTDRLLNADPKWNWEPMGITPEGLPAFDSAGGLWIKLTVCGQTRLGYGNAPSKLSVGDREKEIIGDALRNAAMRFGAALDLWHKGDLHAHEEDQKPEGKVIPMTPQKPPQAVPPPVTNVVFMTDPRIKMVYALAKEANWTEEHLRKFVKHQFSLESNRLLTREQFEILIAHLKTKPGPFEEVKS